MAALFIRVTCVCVTTIHVLKRSSHWIPVTNYRCDLLLVSTSSLITLVAAAVVTESAFISCFTFCGHPYDCLRNTTWFICINNRCIIEARHRGSAKCLNWAMWAEAPASEIIIQLHLFISNTYSETLNRHILYQTYTQHTVRVTSIHCNHTYNGVIVHKQHFHCKKWWELWVDKAHRRTSRDHFTNTFTSMLFEKAVVYYIDILKIAPPWWRG